MLPPPPPPPPPPFSSLVIEFAWQTCSETHLPSFLQIRCLEIITIIIMQNNLQQIAAEVQNVVYVCLRLVFIRCAQIYVVVVVVLQCHQLQI